MSGEVLKIRELENKIARLEAIVAQLVKRVEFHERERLRVKSDISNIASAIRRQ